MTETELIKKLKKLKEIEPRKDWVLSTKSQILGKEATFELFPFFKPAYAGLFCFLILISLFEFSQNALPGEMLFPMKMLVEKSQAVFVSKNEKPKVQLELANKRLEELTEIAQTNQVKKLAPALKAYQMSVAQVTKDLEKMTTTTPDREVIKEIARKTQQLEENKRILERTYGIAGLEVEDESNPTKLVVELLIKDLIGRPLTEEQQKIFEEAILDFVAGKYSEALIKIWKLSYPQE